MIGFILTTLMEDKELNKSLSISIFVVFFVLLLVFTYFFIRNFVKKQEVKLLSIEIRAHDIPGGSVVLFPNDDGIALRIESGIRIEQL